MSTFGQRRGTIAGITDAGLLGGAAMAVDLTLYLDDQPGELARLGDVLGRAGVNIDGFCALTSGGG